MIEISKQKDLRPESLLCASSGVLRKRKPTLKTLQAAQVRYDPAPVADDHNDNEIREWIADALEPAPVARETAFAYRQANPVFVVDNTAAVDYTTYTAINTTNRI